VNLVFLLGSQQVKKVGSSNVALKPQRHGEEWHTPQSQRKMEARMRKATFEDNGHNYFDSRAVLHKESIVQLGVTVDGNHYLEVLALLRKEVI
jgi:hypothetical protein